MYSLTLAKHEFRAGQDGNLVLLSMLPDSLEPIFADTVVVSERSDLDSRGGESAGKVGSDLIAVCLRVDVLAIWTFERVHTWCVQVEVDAAPRCSGWNLWIC
jgi:hypothetical protein